MTRDVISYQQSNGVQREPELLDEDVKRKLRPYLAESDSKNTSKSYRSDWEQFKKWSILMDRSDILPTSSSVLLDYLTDKADLVNSDGSYKFSPPTIARHRISIDRINRDMGFERPGDHPAVRNFLKGLKRSREYRIQRKAPIMTTDIEKMTKTLSRWKLPYAAQDRRDRFLLILGFAGAFRRSELCSLKMRDIKVTESEMIVYLRTSKTDKQSEGKIKGIPYGVHRATCPICAYVEWTEVLLGIDKFRGKVGSIDDRKEVQDDSRAEHVCSEAHLIDTSTIDDGYALRKVSKSGLIGSGETTLSHGSVNLILKKLSARVGIKIEGIGGHSLRAGFVTQALKNGSDSHSIMRQTGHTNPAMIEVYAREHAPLENNAVKNVGL